nr:hypothetical protein [Rhizobium leguminosarum]
MKAKLGNGDMGIGVGDFYPTRTMRPITAFKQRQVRFVPVAYLCIIAVAVNDDDIEMCCEAFDLLLHVQQQVTGRVRIGLMVPLKKNEPRLSIINGAIHVPIEWLQEQ